MIGRTLFPDNTLPKIYRNLLKITHFGEFHSMIMPDFDVKLTKIDDFQYSEL